ncbi:GyrI-like domain-containing protein [Psychrobacillus sp. OK032]|uniref:GyrI-like domain-containing protein n=1 Tax=Psychrobacillus sp. OK032 TaxID=1884358 RepID=UPI0008B6E016|nr:effector binding domain-containing protein [Psychrobacillus sp. OK032]SES08025.1 Predicted transcriptional regulator YdeE, contains AraC-type DNA-binding domain [Psychrobacillus sp. OK032]
MDCKKVKKIFRVVGVKGAGAFVNYGTEVPKLAQHFLTRLDEVENHSGIEIALFEPKREANHLEGHFYVGVIVNENLKEVPVGMDYIEITQSYITTRGEIINIDNLHTRLLKWADEQGYNRDLESHIVEVYHPIENGEEEVEIYLPIHH